jgi:hypothetical protein
MQDVRFGERETISVALKPKNKYVALFDQDKGISSLTGKFHISGHQKAASRSGSVVTNKPGSGPRSNEYETATVDATTVQF